MVAKAHLSVPKVRLMTVEVELMTAEVELTKITKTIARIIGGHTHNGLSVMTFRRNTKFVVANINVTI
jgi:hypothetical protein